MDEPTKRCTGCSIIKPLTEFNRDRAARDGHAYQCRVCMHEYNRRYREDEAYRQAERESYRQYYADNRAAVLERKRRNRAASLGAARERSRRNHAAHREAEQAYKRLYRAHIQALVLNHYGWCCACCGTTRTLSIDHVNGGGKRHREALFGRADGDSIYLWLIRQGFPPGYQTLCNRCNASKAEGARCGLVHPQRPAGR